MNRLLLLSFLFFLKTATVFAQREAENWFFGDKAAIEFPNGGAPVSFLNSAMHAYEGCATISDKNGQLLFYTNGDTVWNNAHMIMKNGTGLMGHHSSVQSSLIVPKPGSSTIYYIFTTDSHENYSAKGLRFSTVDISKDSVLQKGKNTLLYGSITHAVSEKLTGVHHFNNREIWVIAHVNIVSQPLPNNNPILSQEFVAFKVTQNGISLTPVISPLPVPANTYYGSASALKASPSGKYLSGGNWNKTYLFDFDNKTGHVSNPVNLMEGFDNYGVEFSPDGSKLYWSSHSKNVQFNLLAGTPAAIIASKTPVGNWNSGPYAYKAMQLAPDGKIYISKFNTDSLYAINYPNLLGNACSLTPAIKLPAPSKTLHGLPNFIQSYFAPPKFTFTGTCLDNYTYFTISDTSNIDSVRWDFGEPFSGVFNTSTASYPSHWFNYSGPYDVTLKIYTQGHEVIQTRTVTIRATVKPNLGGDQVLCAGLEVTLRAGTPGAFNERYKWYKDTKIATIDTTAFIKVNSPGTYYLELDNDGCISIDSVKISYKPNPKVELGSAKSFCGNATYTLDATYTDHAGATYLWKPGNATTPTLTVNKTGMYSVVVNLDGCTASDSVQITILPDTRFSLGEDKVVCEGEKVYLQAPLTNPPSTYRWSTNVGNRYIIQPDTTGLYWVELTRGGCVSRDSIYVTFKACPPPPVPVIPNLISPNNDGFNDQFIISEIPVGVWHLKILNRWGQLLLDKKGYENDWPKEKLTDGTYYYFLEDPDTGRTWKGWVEVVR